MRRTAALLVRSAILAAALAAPSPAQTAKPAKPAKQDPKAKPASNLDYWLNQAKVVDANKPAAAKPAEDPAAGANPFRKARGPFFHRDALPGVIELSNGKQLPGGVYTTLEKPWIVWDEPTKCWRRVPFINCLSIAAVVEQERMELKWRWKGMGEPEKVFTGKKYPLRRLHWRFKLIDGTVVEGSTKGQPVFVELLGKVAGPFVLHERMKGKEDETLDQLVYVRKIVVSRRMMDAVIADVEEQLKKAPPAKAPADK